MLLSALVERWGGYIVGTPGCDVRIERLSSIAAARSGSLAFLLQRRLREQAQVFGGEALVVPQAQAELACRQWVHPKPEQLWRELAPLFRPFDERRWPGQSPTAWVHPTAVLADDVDLGPGVVLGARVRIGRGCRLGPHVVAEEGSVIGQDCILDSTVYLGPNCILGDRVKVGPSTVIGHPGFGYRAVEGEAYVRRVEHLGGVRIGDDVELGANCCVDAGTFEATQIEDGCRIDNLVHIAHNVVLGSGTLVLAQAGIAGSVRVAPNCILAGQSGVAQGVHLGERCLVAAQAGVARSAGAGARLAGSPAMDAALWRRLMLRLPKLEALFVELRELSARVAALENRDD